MKKRIAVRSLWIPDHSAMSGNEKADELAREAISSCATFGYLPHRDALSTCWEKETLHWMVKLQIFWWIVFRLSQIYPVNASRQTLICICQRALKVVDRQVDLAAYEAYYGHFFHFKIWAIQHVQNSLGIAWRTLVTLSVDVRSCLRSVVHSRITSIGKRFPSLNLGCPSSIAVM